jgi:hypothetical protein
VVDQFGYERAYGVWRIDPFHGSVSDGSLSDSRVRRGRFCQHLMPIYLLSYTYHHTHPRPRPHCLHLRGPRGGSQVRSSWQSCMSRSYDIYSLDKKPIHPRQKAIEQHSKNKKDDRGPIFLILAMFLHFPKTNPQFFLEILGF